MKVTSLCLAAVATAFLVGQASAHHSFAMFDATKMLTLKGTVKELEWTNPHSWLYVMVDEGGQTIEYSLEMQSIGQSVRNGWKPDIVKPGDAVSVEMHPLRTGAHGGQLMTVVLPSVQKIGVTGRAPSAVTGQ